MTWRPQIGYHCCVFSIIICFLVWTVRGIHLSGSGSGLTGSSKASDALLSSHKTRGLCYVEEGTCNEKDEVAFAAIGSLHSQIDDDNDGGVDLTESDGFLRDELQYTDGKERHHKFHGKDTKVSVVELWKIWKSSEVHNWTVAETVQWLVTYVELPQYSESFQANFVDGASLPRIASSPQFISGVLGIKNAVHKQKLTLKAMDVVLFGPPKRGHSLIKDLILVSSLLVAAGGCWFAYLQHNNSKTHLKKMMKDLDILQKAEDSLSELQQRLDNAQKEQKHVQEEKQALEKKMRDEIDDSKREAQRLKEQRENVDEAEQRYKMAEEELDHVRSLLSQAEQQMEDHQWIPPPELQQWLQLTYEIELKHYNVKRTAAEKQLVLAKEGCDKIRKKRNAFMGSLRIAHSSSIDTIDARISEARTSLEEVRKDLQERLNRWRKIELLCGFAIINNPGFSVLEPALKDSIAQSPTQSNLTSQGSESSLSFPTAAVERYAQIWLSKAQLQHRLQTFQGRPPSPGFGTSGSPMIVRQPYCSSAYPNGLSGRGTSPTSTSVTYSRANTDGSRRSSSVMMSDTDDEPSALSTDPKHHGRFYALGLAAMYATSFRRSSRNQQQGMPGMNRPRSQSLIPVPPTGYSSPLGPRMSPCTPPYTVMPHPMSASGFSALYHSQPEVSGGRRLATSRGQSEIWNNLASRPISAAGNENSTLRPGETNVDVSGSPDSDGVQFSLGSPSTPEPDHVTGTEIRFPSVTQPNPAKLRQSTSSEQPRVVKPSVVGVDRGHVTSPRPTSLHVSHSDPLMAFMGAQINQRAPGAERQKPSPVVDKDLIGATINGGHSNGGHSNNGSPSCDSPTLSTRNRTKNGGDVTIKGDSSILQQLEDEANKSDESSETYSDEKKRKHRLTIGVFSKKDKLKKV